MSHALFYQLHGNSQSELPPMVLIHGLFGSSDNLSVIRRHFEHERQVISIDLPDHGKSPRSEQFSFSNTVDKVAELLIDLSLGEYILVGHSLGGKVSMLLANKHPELVDTLIVLDIAPIPYPARHQNVFKGLNAVSLDSINTRSDAKAVLANVLEDTGTQAFLLKSLYQDDNKKWQWRFNLPLIVRDYALLSDWQHEGECFSGPTLFIKGAESNYILPEHQETILTQFPRAKAKVVPAGHWLHAEKPHLVNALITKFLLGK